MGAKQLIYPFQNRDFENSINFVTKVINLIGPKVRLMLDLAVPSNFTETKKFMNEIFANPYLIEGLLMEDISKLVELKLIVLQKL